jgi:hypothetical protein
MADESFSMEAYDKSAQAAEQQRSEAIQPSDAIQCAARDRNQAGCSLGAWSLTNCLLGVGSSSDSMQSGVSHWEAISHQTNDFAPLQETSKTER